MSRHLLYNVFIKIIKFKRGKKREIADDGVRSGSVESRDGRKWGFKGNKKLKWKGAEEKGK